MDLDEIQSVQSRERQTDSLQQLRDSFYEEAGEFVRALREERERAAERADDPFDAPEVNRLSDDIATAEQTLEAIYERRVGKIVKMASLAAADMPTEDEGLTTEERDLFESLVGSIEDSREHVFDVLEGESTATDPETESVRSDAVPGEAGTSTPENDSRGSIPSGDEPGGETSPEAVDGSISAADLMGANEASAAQNAPTDSTGEAETRVPPEESLPETATGEPARRDGGTGTVDPSPDTNGETVPETDVTAARESEPSVERATVRITDDIGEILGVDDRAYDLSADDIVTLPETNADPLVERGAAERLD